jgi:hypothetical protein
MDLSANNHANRSGRSVEDAVWRRGNAGPGGPVRTRGSAPQRSVFIAFGGPLQPVVHPLMVAAQKWLTEAGPEGTPPEGGAMLISWEMLCG